MNTKKYASVIQLVVLLALGGLVVLSLVMPVLPFASARQQPVEVSVLLREDNNAFGSNMRLGMEQAAYDIGAQLRFLTPDIENSHAAQSALLLREVEGGTDALVVIPADPQQLEATLQSMQELPVVSIESPLGANRICVAPDNAAMGQALAQSCATTQQPVLLLSTAARGTGVGQRVESCAAALQEKGIAVEIAQLRAADIGARLGELVQQTGVKSVIAFEHSATEAMISAQIEPYVRLYGVGVTGNIVAALEQHQLAGVAAWSDYAEGYLAVQAAVQAQRGDKLPRSGKTLQPYSLVKFTIVKGADIYEKNNQKLLFPVVN